MDESNSNNTLIGLLSLLISIEVLGIVKANLNINAEQIDILRRSRDIKQHEVDLEKVSAENDLHFYRTVLEKLDKLIERL